MKLEARNFGPVPALFGSARQLLSTNPLLVTIFETQENFLSVHIFIFHFLFLGTIFLPQQLQQKKYFISRVQRSLENKKSIVGDKDDETFFIFQSIFLSRVQYFCLRVSSRPQHRWEIVFDEKRRGWNRTEVERTTSWDFAISDSRDEKKETVRKRNVVKN